MLKNPDITPDGPAELGAAKKLPADEVKSQVLLIEKFKHQLAGQNAFALACPPRALINSI
ncbi:MAG: hypothetical protein AAGG57_15725 [Pseudomonadota bacterium]